MVIGKDLVAAASEPLVLSILSHSESYGYAIIQRVREMSGGRLEWRAGMLYPVLHRLERRGLIQSRWRTGENGRKRKYYRLSQQGSGVLSEQLRQWTLVYETLTRTREEKPCLT